MLKFNLIRGKTQLDETERKEQSKKYIGGPWGIFGTILRTAGLIPMWFAWGVASTGGLLGRHGISPAKVIPPFN